MMDELKLFLRTNMHLILAIGALALFVTLFTVPLFAVETPMFLVPIFGTVGSVGWVVLGIYDTVAQNYALSFTHGTPKRSYKGELRRMRRTRAKIARELYSNKNYDSLRAEPQRQLRVIDEQIAIHTGEKNEAEPVSVKSRW